MKGVINLKKPEMIQGTMSRKVLESYVSTTIAIHLPLSTRARPNRSG